MTMRIGYIGLGSLGRHLAGSLLAAGFPVTVHDLDRDAASALLAAGASWADSAAETARVSDAVITCLPSPDAVGAVVAGPHGILDGLAAGGTWIDMSTNDVARAPAPRRPGRRTGRGDARGTGDRRRAQGGGGHDHRPRRRRRGRLQDHLPAFEAMGGRVFYIGELGQASVIKVITNMLAFIHLVADGEALMLAKRGGVDLNWPGTSSRRAPATASSTRPRASSS